MVLIEDTGALDIGVGGVIEVFDEIVGKVQLNSGNLESVGPVQVNSVCDVETE